MAFLLGPVPAKWAPGNLHRPRPTSSRVICLRRAVELPARPSIGAAIRSPVYELEVIKQGQKVMVDTRKVNPIIHGLPLG